MEAKDLILLILIPLMLISIVAYTDKGTGAMPLITAFAAAQARQEESDVIGSYSVNPSFRAKIDYNLDEYIQIKNELDRLIDACKGSPDIERCFKEKSAELKWNCHESRDEAEDILYDFIDKLNECAALEEDKVVCRFYLKQREISKLVGKFVIILKNENQRVRADLIHGKTWTGYININNLAYIDDYRNKDDSGKNADSVRMEIEYIGKKPVINYVFAVDDNSKNIGLSKTFLFYKSNNYVKFIDELQEGAFRAEKIIDLSRTKGFKFCVRSSDAKNKDIVYKFAVTFPTSGALPAVKVLEADDKLKAENSVVLRWSKAKWEDGSEVSDFSHYNIYCYKNSLEDKDTKEINLNNLKPTVSVKSGNNNNYEVWYAELNKCGKEKIEDGIEYFFAVTLVTKSGNEGKAVRQAVAKPMDELAPGQQEIFLLNSDGKNEKKMSSACIELPKESESGAGNIFVGFYAPKKNEDELTDLAHGELLTYYLHFSKQEPVMAGLDKCDDSRKCVILSYAPKESIADAYELDLRKFGKFREIEKPNNFFEEGNVYCFTVTAKDKAGNIIRTLSSPYKFEKPQQWSNLENNPVIT